MHFRTVMVWNNYKGKLWFFLKPACDFRQYKPWPGFLNFGVCLGQPKMSFGLDYIHRGNQRGTNCFSNL